MSHDSEQRRRAIEETDRSFVVEASAGTGKTGTLIRRILHCVLERGPGEGPLPLSRLCAITFTEKAAGEMKIRLRQEFETVAAAGGEKGVRARQALIDLESAAISTFHSFAVSLLKERPVEAGIDPHFSALDDVHAEILFLEVWDTWLQRAMGERHPALEKALRAGLRLDALRSAARTLRLHARTAAKLRLPPPPCEEEMRQRLKDLRSCGLGYRAMMENPADKLAPVFEDALAWLEAPGEMPLPNLPGSKGAGGNWKGGKDTVAAVRDFVRAVVENGREYRMLPARRAFDGILRLLISEFLPRWQARKRAQGFLDFDDQLWCAHDLLQTSRAAREEFQRRYTALLVDEFQDTDPVQWRIVRLLALRPGEGGEAAGKVEPGRLFLVGDPKQSIYRFRGADIETYGKVTQAEEMSALGIERLSLTNNFRSVPPVLRFVDAAFQGVMTHGQGEPYQPQYLAFGGRGERSGRTGAASVHLLGEWNREGKPAGSGRDFFQLEAVRVARLIATMPGNSDWQVDSDNGDAGIWRPPRLRDVAVLLPVLTQADVLEEALREAGIAYVLEGGKFYYTRSEVSSAITALRALANPNDAVALYGVLRSIFFGISDEDLLRSRVKLEPLDYRVDVVQESVLHRPFSILRELHRARHLRPASETLERLLQQTGAREVLAMRGIQSLANLNKLVRTLRTLQNGSPFSEVVELVAGMDEEGMSESESRVMEAHSDAVRILSIHKAKGLDFPIVIVAGLGLRRLSRQADFLADPHGSGTFALRGGAKDTGLQTPGWEELAAKEKQREESELVRLLYVALTRARDHLILCTHTCGKRDSGDGVPEPGFEGTRLQPLAGFLSVLREGDDPPVHLLDEEAWAGKASPACSAEAAVRRDWGADLAARYRELRRLLAETPHTAGVSTATGGEEVPGAGPAARDPSRDRAIRVGIAFHNAMEAAVFDESINLDDMVRDAGMRQRLEQDGIRRLKEMLVISLASPLIQRVRGAQRSGGRVLREIPYVRPARPDGTGFEEGKIDLLFEEDGGWVLVDYKTDRVPETDPDPSLVQKYMPQIQTYRTALRELGVRIREAYLLMAVTGREILIPDQPPE